MKTFFFFLFFIVSGFFSFSESTKAAGAPGICNCTYKVYEAPCAPGLPYTQYSDSFPTDKISHLSGVDAKDLQKTVAQPSESTCQSGSFFTLINVPIPTKSGKSEYVCEMSCSFVAGPTSGGGAPTCLSLNETDCKKTSNCIFINGACKGVSDMTDAEKLELQKMKTKALLDAYAEQYGPPENYDGPLPKCAFYGNCDDVNDLLELAIKVAQWLFGVIGTIALSVFIYGGFIMIISFGNPDRVKKGQGALVAAVVGIIISFSAYIAVKFILEGLQVSEFFTVPFQDNT